MSRFLFVSWDGGGNQPPAMAIARRLRDRGHRVRVAGYETQRPLLTEMGLEFGGLRRSGSWQRLAEEPLGVLTGVFCNPDHPADIADAAAAFSPDLVVIDCLMFGALTGAEAASVPAVTLVHSGPRALGGGPGLSGLVADRGNSIRQACGLDPVAGVLEAWTRFPALATSFPELDGGDLDGFEFVGPILDERRGGWSSPWPAADSRPLVLVSLSTTRAFGNQARRYQAIMDAGSDMTVRLLLTTAGVVDAAELEPPANAALAGVVSHGAALSQAAACVTHAGHGTVCAALHAGVPSICMPNPRADQPFLASRVAELGAGLRLDQDAGASEIRDGLAEVLANPAYAKSAAALGAAIDRMPGLDSAATRLEELVGVAAR